MIEESEIDRLQKQILNTAEYYSELDLENKKLKEENERTLSTARKNYNDLQAQLKMNQQLMDIIEMMTEKLVDK